MIGRIGGRAEEPRHHSSIDPLSRRMRRWVGGWIGLLALVAGLVLDSPFATAEAGAQGSVGQGAVALCLAPGSPADGHQTLPAVPVPGAAHHGCPFCPCCPPAAAADVPPSGPALTLPAFARLAVIIPGTAPALDRRRVHQPRLSRGPPAQA